MKSFSFILRNRFGDLTLPFFGFILVATLTIASLTSISQYNIIVEKLNAGLEEANKASVKYILDNVSDSALIGTLSPTVQAELANARSQGVAVAQNSLTTKIKDLIAVRNGDGVNVFDIADSSITKDADDNVIIQFAVEAQVLPPPTPKYKRVFKKVVAKPFSLNSREVCTELDCPPGDCGDCGACDECTGTCIPDFSVPDGQGGFKNPDTATATDDNIACAINDRCEVIGDGWEEFEEHGITGCIKDNCKYLPNHHTANEDNAAMPIAWGTPVAAGKHYIIGSRPDCDSSTGCTETTLPTKRFQYDDMPAYFTSEPGYSDFCVSGMEYELGTETTVSELSDNSDSPGGKTYALCESAYNPNNDEYTIFLTSTRQISGGGSGGFDGVCRTRALAVGLANASLYRAMVGTMTTAIRDYVDLDASYFLVDGTLVNSCPLIPRDSWPYNEYPLNTQINMTEGGVTLSYPGDSLSGGYFGRPQLELGVWTGAYSDGSLYADSGVIHSYFYNCNSWSLATSTDRGVIADFQDENCWLGQCLGSFGGSYDLAECDGSYPYTFTPPLTLTGYKLYCYGPR